MGEKINNILKGEIISSVDVYKRQGVLRSPIVGCTTEELAELRIAYPEGMIYECVCLSLIHI